MTTVAVIGGLSLGWIVGGVIAAGLPVIAHLLARRGGRPLLFPAVWFVMQAAAEYARRRRLRDRLLLALRILAIALLALAFDRPTWSAKAAAPDEKDGRDVVIVVDVSASMTRTHLGRSIHDAAVDEARQVIADLDPARDRAGVVFAGATARGALPRLTMNFDALLAALGASEGTLEHADLGAGLALAASMPGDSEEGVRRARRVVLLSDRQRGQWDGFEAPSDVDVTLRLLGPESTTPNLALLDATVTPARPVPGEAAMVSVRVVNSGDSARSPTLTVRIDGRPEQERMTTLGPGGETTVTIPVSFAAAGQYGVTFSLVDERYTVDDAAYAVADVRPFRRVAVITRGAPEDAAAGLYYMLAALRPDAQSRWQPTVLAPEALSVELLGSFDAAVLINAEAPDAATLAALHEAAASGLGVLWVVDSVRAHTALDVFERVDLDTTALPTRPVNTFALYEADEAMGLERGVFDAPPLNLLQGGASEALMSAVMLGVSPARLSPVGFEVLGYAGGGPCLAWSRFGSGRIAVLHADMAPGRSSLVKSPLFPVLAHELPGFLAPGDGGGMEARVGLPLRARCRSGLTVRPPVVAERSGRQVSVTAGIAGAAAEVQGEPPAAPGLVRFTDQSDTVVALAAVNVDARESDTRAVSVDEIRGRFEAMQVPEGAGVAAGRSLLGAKPIELWPWMLVGVIGLLVVESLLANRRGLRDESEGDA